MALGYNVLPVLYSIAGKSGHDVVVPSITESHLASSLGLFPARAYTIYLLELSLCSVDPVCCPPSHFCRRGKLKATSPWSKLT